MTIFIYLFIINYINIVFNYTIFNKQKICPIKDYFVFVLNKK